MTTHTQAAAAFGKSLTGRQREAWLAYVLADGQRDAALADTLDIILQRLERIETLLSPSPDAPPDDGHDTTGLPQ
jgi:hypothetical protein